jgi:hypothetical protein
LPVGERPPAADDLHVRGEAEDAVAHLVLEAVHHRQHHDQHRHAERDADHRDEGVGAEEAAAPLGARVAQADEKLVSHGAARILQSLKWTWSLRISFEG